jgi:hypothetical protein
MSSLGYNLKTFEIEWVRLIFLVANGGVDWHPNFFNSESDFLIFLKKICAPKMWERIM